MIARVHDRGTFEALRRDGRRVRRGPVTVVYLPADASDPSALPAPSRAAFAISRKVGNAVKRNQLRRRLRTILRDAEHPPEGEHGLAPGTYLVTARPSVTDLSYQALSQLVGSACAEVARSREGGR